MIQEIQTGDLFRSAALICGGGHLKESSLIDRAHVVFVIEGDSIEKEDQSYLDGKSLVNPLKLQKIINQLRDIIYQQVKTGDRKYGQNTKRGNRENQTECRSSRGHQGEGDRAKAPGAAARGNVSFS
jgi:hypothetical protein